MAFKPVIQRANGALWATGAQLVCVISSVLCVFPGCCSTTAASFFPLVFLLRTLSEAMYCRIWWEFTQNAAPTCTLIQKLCLSLSEKNKPNHHQAKRNKCFFIPIACSYQESVTYTPVPGLSYSKLSCFSNHSLPFAFIHSFPKYHGAQILSIAWPQFSNLVICFFVTLLKYFNFYTVR